MCASSEMGTSTHRTPHRPGRRGPARAVSALATAVRINDHGAQEVLVRGAQVPESRIAACADTSTGLLPTAWRLLALSEYPDHTPLAEAWLASTLRATGTTSSPDPDRPRAATTVATELTIQQVSGLNAIGALVDRCNAHIA